MIYEDPKSEAGGAYSIERGEAVVSLSNSQGESGFQSAGVSQANTSNFGSDE